MAQAQYFFTPCDAQLSFMIKAFQHSPQLAILTSSSIIDNGENCAT